MVDCMWAACELDVHVQEMNGGKGEKAYVWMLP